MTAKPFMSPSSDQPDSQHDTHQPTSQASSSDGVDAVDWDRLGSYVESFLEAWEADGFGPLLNEHLPHDDIALRRMTLIELIKVDLEYRHNSDGAALRLEDYLAEHPELGQPDGMPAELIHEEFHIRRAAGESVSGQDCLKRFPDKAAEIGQLFQLESTSNMEPSGTTLTEAFQPGERVGDFYLMSALGAGAFGSVFLARQESMQRLVALKISGDRGSEGQTLAQLDHPHIVRVHDQTRLPEQNLRLLYMQFAAGGTLQAVIKTANSAELKTGRIVAECIAAAVEKTGVLSAQSIPLKGGIADKPWSEVTCQLGMELAHALHYAHGRGILHRDIKPANVLLEANGAAKLADFNISFSSATEGATPAAYFGGSLAYMSPEQLQAFDPTHATKPEDLDARADVFSLGVLLWELFYGKRPFDDEAIGGSMSDMLSGMIKLRHDGGSEPPERSANAVEQQLFRILSRCLAPDPDDRYQTANEVARELGLCLQPRVAQLMHCSQAGWRRLAIAWPLAALLFAAIFPHVPAAMFNYVYNERAIVKQLSAEAEPVFTRFVIAINVVAFSIGFACCIWFTRPIVNRVRKRNTRSGLPATTASSVPANSGDEGSLSSIRVRTLRYSRFVTILGISEWIIAGMAYPIALNAAEGMDLKWQAHFFVSLLVCGLVAAAYPFFLTATLAIRAFIPALIRNGQLTAQDQSELHRLSEQSIWSLYLAGGVPAVGMMILLSTQDTAASKFPLQVFSVLGAVGFAFVLSLAKSLQSDIEALLESARLLAEDAAVLN
ncbi:serine/threonine-protein kinase [Fuerstiella marisgermanici]|uniref:Serine/threonine-protein kinase PknB n=1 Tax=Fuerstiella marisgermanici TaxID=1891926 RepID=A0A1P8WLY2_9PLAN|nr:serine/threonine-protein kinase [Fuerstiella marisgermanici]APZ95058.1 Serine/threonine-protein kinase PknB [Fuerstiella marisgermanici]